MSMKIKINKDTNKTVYYTGKVSFPNKTPYSYRFTVPFLIFGEHREPVFGDVDWDDLPLEPSKAEDRIKSLITKIREKDNE